MQSSLLVLIRWRLTLAQNELEIKQQEHQKLQKDLESLDNFMQTLDKRSKQVIKQLDEFRKRIIDLGALFSRPSIGSAASERPRTEEAKVARQQERSELQRQVNAQNLSDAEVQRLTTDRHNLDEQARQLTDRETVLTREAAELQVDLERVLDRVERHCDDYTTRMSRHSLLPRPASGEYRDVDFAQDLNGAAASPADIVPDASKSAGIRPALLKMKQQAGVERNTHIDAALLVEAELGTLNERLAELVESLNGAETEYASHREELEATREVRSRFLL